MKKYAFLVWNDYPEQTTGNRVVVEAANSFVAIRLLLERTKSEIVKYREVDLVEQPENWKPVRRASGQAPCEFCGHLLDLHQQPTRATAPTVVVDCAGNWLKT